MCSSSCGRRRANRQELCQSQHSQLKTYQLMIFAFEKENVPFFNLGLSCTCIYAYIHTCCVCRCVCTYIYIYIYICIYIYGQ